MDAVKQKVVIIGGGIGGLACAHTLSKHPEKYDIYLYERNTELGGLARSKYNQYGKHTEYCWHAFSSGYNHLLPILNEIIDDEKVKVISHLKPLDNFVYGMAGKNCVETTNSFITDPTLFFHEFHELYDENVTILDRLRLLKLAFVAKYICDEKLKEYDSVLWADYVRDFSPHVKRWILDSTAIYLGMDYNKISVYFMLNLIRRQFDSRLSDLVDHRHVFYSLDGPMNDTFINVWMNHLKSLGVKIYLKSTINKFIMDGDKINSVMLTENGREKYIRGDIFVNAAGAEKLAELYPSGRLVVSKNKFRRLARNSRQIQVQVLFYLPYRLQASSMKPTILILPDTPWFLMVRIEGELWDLKDSELLSCGIGIWDIPGSLFHTPAINCTRTELAQECWNQIQESQHNLKLSSNIPMWDIWDSYEYDTKTGKMDTYEPKYSNNINTLKLRPDFKDDDICNLYHAAAYVKTKMDVYNMESAAEAGVKSANLIIGVQTPNYEHIGCFTKMLRYINSVFYRFLRLF